MADGTSAGISRADIIAQQRSSQGLAYDQKRQALRDKLKTDREFRQRMHADMLKIRSVGPGEVHSNTFLSNVSIQYQNDEFIGTRLMPIVDVAKRSDAFAIYTKRDRFAVPEDEIGSKSDANELDESRTSDNYSVKDYALKNFVAGTTIESEDSSFDEMMDLVEAINDGLRLKEEKRIATILTTAGNFSGNTVTLSGSDQWDSGAGGNPLKAIQDARRACYMGRGPGEYYGYCSGDAWAVLSRHPQLLDLFKNVTPGLVKAQNLAAQLGLAGILVGEAREDTANKGHTASYSRIWGKDFGIVRVASRPTLRNAAFGYTLRFRGHPITTQWFDPSKGLGGGYFAKVGMAEDHKIVAADTGYLIKAVVS